ncbi:MAG: hypothetical protein LQ352_003439 [Teloschistes flavicans]|nr:MAG: hypothetical protein LQ352_003439 [Teloschistes flavicans]
MPPVSPPSEPQDIVEDNSPLSDQDVEILYQIITAAEQDTDVEAHPFRSIFAAYDTVLARHGIRPDHDRIYFRFLLRLRETRRAGETLYESFESLLAELGIQIEINPEENGIQDVTRSFNATVENSPNLRPQPRAGSDSGVHSRRASLHVAADAEVEGNRVPRIRSSSRASIAETQRGQGARSTDRPSTRATTRPTERFNHQALHHQPLAQPARGRLTAKEFANNLQHYQRRHASASDMHTRAHYDRNISRHQTRSQSAQRPLVQEQEDHQVTGNGPQEIIHSEDQIEDSDDDRSWSSGNPDQAYRVDHRELFYQPTDNHLIRDAAAFEHFRLRALLRNAVRRWQAVTSDCKQKHEHLASQAQSHDHGILLRQSFDIWKGNLHIKMQAAATEQFYLRLELRAGKARDLYLLTKAFTHWQQITRDKMNHAVDARQQILRVKYFSAWLELTAVNCRKVRLQILWKFYNSWKQRYLALSGLNNKAFLTQERGLLKIAYWRWFWAFCDRRAPQWHDGRLRSSVFTHWALSTQRRSYQEFDVALRKDALIKKTCFSRWLSQARSILTQNEEAKRFHKQKITTRSLLVCRKTIRYAPFIRQVSNMADWRIAGSTFAILVNRVRTGQQANKVNQLRVLRNAWTTWNDRLRWQTLEDQIDDRVLVQALYRWVLAERCALQQRVCEQRILYICLRKLIDEYRARSAVRMAIRLGFERERQAKISRIVIHGWHRALQIHQRNVQVAFQFEAPRVALETMSAWSDRMSHLRKLERRSVDFCYYFRTTKMLKQWRASTLEAKRRKVRDAYGQVRRQNKMQLARHCLQIWRDRAQSVKRMEEHAKVHDQSQLFQFATRLYDHWKTRHGFLVDRQDQTVSEFARRFMYNQFDTWTARCRTQAQLEELARVSSQLRISNIAFGWLHKLHLRVIEVKGRESKAESLRRWYQKRHSHNLLRQWHDKVAKRRDQPLPPPVFSSRARRIGPRQDTEGQEEVAGRAEEWTAFDEGFDLGDWIPALEAQTSSTPLPGYLSTPSKRAARARGLVRISTTPAGTPFATRLRSQLGREQQSTRRTERPNTGLGGSTFAPIPETSPRTPGGS